MRTVNSYAAQAAGRLGNEYSTILASMPNRFFCLTVDQESRVWQAIIRAWDNGTHDIYELKRIAHKAVEEA